MIHEPSPSSSSEKALRWVGLELFSVWRHSALLEPVVNSACVKQLVDIAAAEDRTFEGRNIRELAANVPAGDLQEYLSGLIRAVNKVPTSSFDVPGLKEHGLRVDEYLGRGAMGVVHRCWQYKPGRNIAIKFIASQGNSEVRRELEERFRDETEIVGNLNHPGIAHVYFGGSVKDWRGHDLTFIAMELIEGGTLQEAINAPASSPKDTIARCKLFSQICDAVQHAHAPGNKIFHRDIKPTNILLDGSSRNPLHRRPKLVDFGLAQIMADITPNGPIGPSGTPGYRSPAVLRGSETNPARVDIFSLGIVFYRILCGAEPKGLGPPDFVHLKQIEDASARCQAEAKQIEEILATGIALPCTVASKSLRLDLESILTRAIDAQSPDAYSSVAQLTEDVSRFLNGRTVTSNHRNTRILRAARWTTRNPAIAMLCLLAVVLSIGGGIAFVGVKAQAAWAEQQVAETNIAGVDSENGEIRAKYLLEIANEPSPDVRARMFQLVLASDDNARIFINNRADLVDFGIRGDRDVRDRVRALLSDVAKNCGQRNDFESPVAIATTLLGLEIGADRGQGGAVFSDFALRVLLATPYNDVVLEHEQLQLAVCRFARQTEPGQRLTTLSSVLHGLSRTSELQSTYSGEYWDCERHTVAISVLLASLPTSQSSEAVDELIEMIPNLKSHQYGPFTNAITSALADSQRRRLAAPLIARGIAIINGEPEPNAFCATLRALKRLGHSPAEREIEEIVVKAATLVSTCRPLMVRDVCVEADRIANTIVELPPLPEPEGQVAANHVCRLIPVLKSHQIPHMTRIVLWLPASVRAKSIAALDERIAKGIPDETLYDLPQYALALGRLRDVDDGRLLVELSEHLEEMTPNCSLSELDRIAAASTAIASPNSDVQGRVALRLTEYVVSAEVGELPDLAVIANRIQDEPIRRMMIDTIRERLSASSTENLVQLGKALSLLLPREEHPLFRPLYTKAAGQKCLGRLLNEMESLLQPADVSLLLDSSWSPQDVSAFRDIETVNVGLRHADDKELMFLLQNSTTSPRFRRSVVRLIGTRVSAGTPQQPIESRWDLLDWLKTGDQYHSLLPQP